MLTEVCSLRDRGEPQDRDVVCTRPGPWGNAYTLHRHGYKVLDHYRRDIRALIANCLRVAKNAKPHLVHEAEAWLFALKGLAGKRLLCACPSDSLACHAWILAEVVQELTGVPVKPAPGRERA